MSDPRTFGLEEADDELEPQGQDEGGLDPLDPEAHRKANQQLQKHAKKLEQENAVYRTQLVGMYLDSLGLAPDVGLGKAIVKEYKGEITAEALATYAAEEYGHTVATPPTPPEVIQTQNIDLMHLQGQQAVPTTPLTPAQEADQKMHDPNTGREDAAASIAAKAIEFGQQHYGPQGPQGPPQQ